MRVCAAGRSSWTRLQRCWTPIPGWRWPWARARPRSSGTSRSCRCFACLRGAGNRPRRAELGAGVVALVVLDGLLAAGTPVTVIGPGDVLEPWDLGVTWTACTPARLAVIGTRFMEAVRPWPGAAAHLLARAWSGATPAESRGTVDERAARPPVADRRPLGRPSRRCHRAAARARRRSRGGAARGARRRRSPRRPRGSPRAACSSAARTRRGCCATPRRGRRPAIRAHGATSLRSRGAQQLALAREMRATFLALSERTAAQLEAGRKRRD